MYVSGKTTNTWQQPEYILHVTDSEDDVIARHSIDVQPPFSARAAPGIAIYLKDRAPTKSLKEQRGGRMSAQRNKSLKEQHGGWMSAQRVKVTAFLCISATIRYSLP
jgi:hypothetical protein